MSYSDFRNQDMQLNMLESNDVIQHIQDNSKKKSMAECLANMCMKKSRIKVDHMYCDREIVAYNYTKIIFLYAMNNCGIDMQYLPNNPHNFRLRQINQYIMSKLVSFFEDVSIDTPDFNLFTYCCNNSRKNIDDFVSYLKCN